MGRRQERRWDQHNDMPRDGKEARSDLIGQNALRRKNKRRSGQGCQARQSTVKQRPDTSSLRVGTASNAKKALAKREIRYS